MFATRCFCNFTIFKSLNALIEQWIISVASPSFLSNKILNTNFLFFISKFVRHAMTRKHTNKRRKKKNGNTEYSSSIVTIRLFTFYSVGVFMFLMEITLKTTCSSTQLRFQSKHTYTQFTFQLLITIFTYVSVFCVLPFDICFEKCFSISAYPAANWCLFKLDFLEKFLFKQFYLCIWHFYIKLFSCIFYVCRHIDLRAPRNIFILLVSDSFYVQKLNKPK